MIAIVGGQWFPVAACSSVQLRNVELRQVRITTQAGVDLMRLDPPSGIPIGPRRFIMLDSQGVHDMRTRPNGDPPDPVLNCVDRFEQPGGLGG